ncbi:MAG: hypothetical protein LBI08_01505 [Methanomassiliicoccaceae archaeon]|jgi:hypothetical protein|nr:hypothetical protein [Methanomassiliicoccaceae archaeon]
MDTPQYGPMFRFGDTNVYWALHLLSDGKRMGRKILADLVGVGEGSMRRILDTLKEWEMISVKQTGITITKTGIGFLNELPLRVLDLNVGDVVLGSCQQAVKVFGVSSKIENGMQQRDAGIRAGAAGCTTIVFRGGKLMMPPDWDLDKERPAIAERIRRHVGLGADDVIIIGGADDMHAAVNAALAAAFELF